jgi:hypothetical protein
VLLAGTDVEGRITQKAERPGKKGPSYSADYVYTVGETEYAARTSLTADDYAGLEVGQTIPVRAWEAAPEIGHWPGVPGDQPVRGVVGLGVAALFWNGIMSIFLWFLYVVPWRQRQLVRYGVPTRGVVRAIAFCKDGKAEARRITYDYTPGPSAVFGGQRSGSVKVTPAKAAEVKVGNVLTVLYDPRRPHRSVLYRLGNYRAR